MFGVKWKTCGDWDHQKARRATLCDLCGLKREPHQRATTRQTFTLQWVLRFPNPIIALHMRQALIRLLEMRHEVGAVRVVLCSSQLAGCHGQRLISTRVPWRIYSCSRRSRRPPGLSGVVGALRSRICMPFFSCSRSPDVACVCVERRGIQLADAVGFGIKIRIVAVEPVLALVRFEINVMKDAQMLERLSASVCRASRTVATISSKVHRVTVRSWSWGNVLATEITWTRVGAVMARGRPERLAS